MLLINQMQGNLHVDEVPRKPLKAENQICFRYPHVNYINF